MSRDSLVGEVEAEDAGRGGWRTRRGTPTVSTLEADARRCRDHGGKCRGRGSEFAPCVPFVVAVRPSGSLWLLLSGLCTDHPPSPPTRLRRARGCVNATDVRVWEGSPDVSHCG